MPDPQIQKLLIVQDRDVELLKIEQELKRIPIERQNLEAKVIAERENIEVAQKTLREKEVRRSELDADVKAQEAAVNRFRTQQLEVKKNDEYRALTQQIDQAEKAISDLEEAEIALMLEIDLEQEKFKLEKVAIESRIKELNRLTDVLAEREREMQASLLQARNLASEVREGVDSNYLEHYERVKKLTKRAPFVVPIVEHKCGGCHLRVSNEVSRGAMISGEPHFCDQCARLVYA
ncbi:MAG: zinc ribbon domain-containing protein [Opitutales bacterium]